MRMASAHLIVKVRGHRLQVGCGIDAADDKPESPNPANPAVKKRRLRHVRDAKGADGAHAWPGNLAFSRILSHPLASIGAKTEPPWKIRLRDGDNFVMAP
jgi:hypothetical protein